MFNLGGKTNVKALENINQNDILLSSSPFNNPVLAQSAKF
jgi:hypothetical protein